MTVHISLEDRGYGALCPVFVNGCLIQI
eukprot:COSAG02_NODE_17454_length_1002_cov_1.018826_1_plen_27_part_10